MSKIQLVLKKDYFCGNKKMAAGDIIIEAIVGNPLSAERIDKMIQNQAIRIIEVKEKSENNKKAGGK
jgi:TusA-related sulfurtransferase